MPLIFDVFQAIRNDHIENLKRLVSLDGYDHNATFQGTTALSLCIYMDHLSCFTILLESGAPLNNKSMDHLSRIETPIISSIRLGRNEIFWKLLQNGAKLDIADFYNHAPLWFAVKEQRVSFVKLLLSMGGPITFNDARVSPLNLVVQYLCYRVRRELAVELVDAGLQLDLIDVDNKTPLLWALHHSDFSFFFLLIEAGAPLQLKIKDKDHKIPRKWTQDPKISAWIKKETAIPAPLFRQCRTKIRAHLRVLYNKDVRPIIRSMPLPKVLQDYLLLGDAMRLTDFKIENLQLTRDFEGISQFDQPVPPSSFIDPFSMFHKNVS